MQVRFYYSFTSKENLYIVMEYLNGGDCYRCDRTQYALCCSPFVLSFQPCPHLATC